MPLYAGGGGEYDIFCHLAIYTVDNSTHFPATFAQFRGYNTTVGSDNALLFGDEGCAGSSRLR